MRVAVDLAGRKFGRWKVLRFSHAIRPTKYWLCKCSCGKEKAICAQNLICGKSKSCGCLAAQESKKRLKKYTYDFVKDTIENYGYVLLSKAFNSVDQKLDVVCDKGHTYHPRFSTILRGRLCSICAGVAAYTFDFVKQTIEHRGGLLISKTYNGSRQELHVICANGHEWHPVFDSILRGHWCGICGKNQSSVSECNALAAEHNGKCISVEYIDHKTKMEWECELGHRWLASRQRIVDGSWCPECSANKTQGCLVDIVREIFPGHVICFNYRGFSWLETSPGHKQEFDIYVPHICLAIEYDGEQHFMPVRYGGISAEQAMVNLLKTQERDAVKDKKVIEHSGEIKYFIRFNYTERGDLDAAYVGNALAKIGVPLGLQTRPGK
jgi:hypothetical protein